MPSARPTGRERSRPAQDTVDAKLKRSQSLMLDYRATFAGAAGQRVLAHLLQHCGVLYPSPDQYTEGKRAVGMHLIEMISRDPSDLTQFMISSNTEDLYHVGNHDDAGNAD